MAEAVEELLLPIPPITLEDPYSTSATSQSYAQFYCNTYTAGIGIVIMIIGLVVNNLFLKNKTGKFDAV